MQRIAPGSRFELDELVIPGSPAVRPVALDAIRQQGIEIRGLTAEEGRLDTFYRELIGESG
jgi:Cu-processing system ATP-binding protein